MGIHIKCACVVEMEYTCDLSSHARRIEGSTPSASTMNYVANNSERLSRE